MLNKKSVSYSIPNTTLHYIFILIFTNLALFSIVLKYIPINSFYLTFAFSMLYVTFLNKWHLFLNLLRKEILLLSLITIYSLAILFFKQSDFQIVKIPILLFGFLVTVFFIISFCLKYNFDPIKLFQGVIFINVLFTILLSLSPDIYNVFSIIIDFKYANSEASSIVDDSRGFGLMSRGPYYAYPILIGFSIIIRLERIEKSFYGYIKALPVLLMSLIAIGINARIGFVPVIVYMIFFIFSKLSLKRIIITGFLISLFIYFLTQGFIVINEKMEWVIAPFIWAYNFLANNGGEIGHIRSLLGNFIFFPEIINDLIFGTGANVFNGSFHPDSGSRHSDVGFIRQIFFGGITYVILIFLFIFYLTKNNYFISRIQKRNYFLASIFILSLIICNIKGSIFQPNCVMFFLLFIKTNSLYKSIYKK
jgi:hypothetical protein